MKGREYLNLKTDEREIKGVKTVHNKWPLAYYPFLSWGGYNGVQATGKKTPCP